MHLVNQDQGGGVLDTMLCSCGYIFGINLHITFITKAGLTSGLMPGSNLLSPGCFEWAIMSSPSELSTPVPLIAQVKVSR